MKKALIPLLVIVLALAATAGGVLAVTGQDDGEPPSDGASIRSDEDIDPNECNLVHNINACDADDLDRLGGDVIIPGGSGGVVGGQIDVSVNFNESVTQDDIDEVGAFLREFDPNLEFAILEIFPPIGSATMTAEIDVCPTIEADLEAETYVRAVSCEEYQVIDVANPDEPVVDPAD